MEASMAASESLGSLLVSSRQRRSILKCCTVYLTVKSFQAGIVFGPAVEVTPDVLLLVARRATISYVSLSLWVNTCTWETEE